MISKIKRYLNIYFFSSIFTIIQGAVALAKGELRKDGRNEHFTGEWCNQKMFVEFIWNENILSTFLAIWHLCPKGLTQRVVCKHRYCKLSKIRNLGAHAHGQTEKVLEDCLAVLDLYYITVMENVVWVLELLV